MDIMSIIETIPPALIIPIALIWLIWEILKRTLPKGDDSEDDEPDAIG